MGNIPASGCACSDRPHISCSGRIMDIAERSGVPSSSSCRCRACVLLSIGRVCCLLACFFGTVHASPHNGLPPCGGHMWSPTSTEAYVAGGLPRQSTHDRQAMTLPGAKYANFAKVIPRARWDPKSTSGKMRFLSGRRAAPCFYLHMGPIRLLRCMSLVGT